MAATSVFVLAPDFPELDGAQMLGGPYETSLRRAAELGYDGVELIMGDPDAFDSGSFQTLLHQHGLKISAINCGGIETLRHLYERFGLNMQQTATHTF